MRRTLVLDASRGSVGGGRIELQAVGWDERTSNAEAADLGGAGDQCGIGLTTTPDPAYVIESICSDPTAEGLVALVGTSSRNGFRPRLATLPAETAPQGTLLRRILEDVPSVVSLSRLASIHADAAGQVAGPSSRGPLRQAPGDVCSGWAAGSTMSVMVEKGHSPVAGHDDPIVADNDDFQVIGVTALGVGWFRRHRQVTVTDSSRAGRGTVRVESRFRDTYVMLDGRERVEHEYLISADIDAASRRVSSCWARPGSLPAPECAAAKESAGWLVGLPLDQLASTIRRRFRGPLTCTHLNEALHGLADVEALLDAIRVERRVLTSTKAEALGSSEEGSGGPVLAG